MADSKTKAKKLLERGAKLVPDIAPGVVGAVVGGAGGAVAAGLGKVLMDQAADWTMRQLSDRQLDRIAEVMVWAHHYLEVSTAEGRFPRSEFLDGESDREDIHQEVLEAVVAAARDAAERRRVRHLGAFFANFACNPGLSPDDAHQLLRLADEMSYRQMQVLQIFREMNGRSGWESNNIRELDRDYAPLRVEIIRLRSFWLLTSPYGTFATPINITPLGMRLATLLGLDTVNRDDTFLALERMLRKHYLADQPGEHGMHDDGED